MSRRLWDPLPNWGALERWHAEIRSGKRRNVAADFDNLHAAACNELAARECEALGDRSGAERFMNRALLRLHGCFHEPDDGTAPNPGPGRRRLAQLKAERIDPDRSTGDPFANVKVSRAPRWAAA